MSSLATTTGSASAARFEEDASAVRIGAFATALAGYSYILVVGFGAAATIPLGLRFWMALSNHDLALVRATANIGAMAISYGAMKVAWSTVAGFMIPRYEAEGVTLQAQAAQPLRRKIAKLAGSLGVEAPTTIVITYDGASWLSIATRENGRRATALYIGIATLLTLSQDELEATLAHELAHLRTHDARLTNYIERALERWCAYSARFTQRRRFGALPFAIVSHRFIDALAAPLARLSRSSEIEADRAAATCTRPQVLATALVRLAVQSLRAEEVLWPAFERSALAGNALPRDYCKRWSEHATAVRSSGAPKTTVGWYNLALHQQAADDDSHPTLTQRLAALDVDPTCITKGTECTDCPQQAIALLGDQREEIETAVNDEWCEAHAAEWEMAAERGAFLKNLIEAPFQKDSPEASADAALARAGALEELGDEERAMELLRSLLASDVTLDEARFHLARLLLKRGDDEGIRHMDAVVESTERFRLNGVSHLMDFMIRSGRFEEADRYQCVIDASSELIDAAARERAGLGNDDVFVVHDLDRAYIDRVQSVLADTGQIHVAYLVRKQLQHDLGDRIYVLAIDAPRKMIGQSLDDFDLQRLLEEKLILPGYTEIAFLNGWEAWLRPALVGIPDACVFHCP